MKSTFLLFAIITATHLSLTESKSLRDDDDNEATIQRKILGQFQALKYGDDCSWDVEETRQRYTRKGLSAGDNELAKELLLKIYENGWKLCSSPELFVCDKDSQKCVCGDASYESLYGANRELYTLEGDGKCRRDTNTFCRPDEGAPSFNNDAGIVADDKCRSGTSCVARDGQACSRQGMISDLFNNYDDTFLATRASINKVMYSGKLCSCQLDQEGRSRSSVIKDKSKLLVPSMAL